MYNKESKQTNNFKQGIGYLEEVFEDLSNRVKEPLLFEMEREKTETKNNITIKISLENAKPNKQERK